MWSLKKAARLAIKQCLRYESTLKTTVLGIKQCEGIMEEHALKKVNNCLNTKTYSYLETSGGQSSNLYLNVVHCFKISVN